jgi:hypothetical protein
MTKRRRALERGTGTIVLSNWKGVYEIADSIVDGSEMPDVLFLEVCFGGMSGRVDLSW